MPLLGVCGWPVAHSRSPAMHEAAFAAAGLDGWRYLKLPLPPELFAETVRALPAAGFRGVNVTIPHKEAALALADEASDAAREIGAANTLTFERDGAIHADNTDAPGLIAALGEAWAPAGRQRARARRRRGRAGRRVGARTGRRGRCGGLEPHPRAGRRARRRSSARAPCESPVTAEIVVNCTSVGLAGVGREGYPRSRRYPSRPIAWVPEAAWWTWSTGTAGRDSSKRQEREEPT